MYRIFAVLFVGHRPEEPRMSRKKSLYEILQVAPDAPYADVRASYQRLLLALQAQVATLEPESYKLQQRLLQVAWSTLSNPQSRDAYDASQAVRQEPVAASPALALVPMQPPAEAVHLRADAMLLRAEAMALRADALGLRADAATPSLASRTPFTPAADSSALSGLGPSLRRILAALGAATALLAAFKLVFWLWTPHPLEVSGTARQQAEDKVFLQDYYQTYGVRPANRAEAAALDAARLDKQNAQKAALAAQNAQRKAIDSEKKFEEESRRRAEQVSTELHYTEEKARMAAQEEERRQRYDRETERARAEEAERRRTQAQQAEWQRTLSRGSYR